jgi:hypothetical protein
MRRRLQRLNDAVCRDPTERGRLLGMRMPTPLGAVIDSMKAASSRASPGVGSRGHRLTLWLLTPCRRATLFEEPERGISFAPDVRYHRADASPLSSGARLISRWRSCGTSLMERKRAVTAALTVRGDMAPYRFEGCESVRFAHENRR